MGIFDTIFKTIQFIQNVAETAEKVNSIGIQARNMYHETISDYHYRQNNRPENRARAANEYRNTLYDLAERKCISGEFFNSELNRIGDDVDYYDLVVKNKK